MSIYGLLQFGVPSQGMNIDALVSMVKNKPSRYVLEQLNPEGGQSAREKEHREFCEAFSVSGSQIRYFYEAKRGPTVKWVCQQPLNLDNFVLTFQRTKIKRDGILAAKKSWQ